MLNFSNTLKSKTIIILQIFILIFIGFYIKKNYFNTQNDNLNKKKEYFATPAPSNPKITFTTDIKDIKNVLNVKLITEIKDKLTEFNTELDKKLEIKETDAKKQIAEVKKKYEEINKELDSLYKKIKDEQDSTEKKNLTNQAEKIKEIYNIIKVKTEELEMIDKKKERQTFELEYNNIFKEEKLFPLSCLLELKSTENMNLFIRSQIDYDYTSSLEKIKNSSNNHYIILFEGENFDGNFIILNDTIEKDKSSVLNNFKSLKIVTKNYYEDSYLQNFSNKKNEILLFSEKNYLGKCYRIKLQPNEIILDENNNKEELKSFRTFFKDNEIKSILLPGETENQNNRTFRNIRFSITDKNQKATSVTKNESDLSSKKIIIGSTQVIIDGVIQTQSTYSVLARYSHLDTKTANKVLKENEQQLKKLDFELTQKIDEKIKKQKTTKQLENKVMDKLVDRISNEITNNTYKMNFIKDN